MVAVDADPVSIERLYESLRSEGSTTILPLTMDLTDPSPALGWNGIERQPLLARGRPDLVLCLALVHHLSISGNVPIAEFLDWLRQLSTAIVIEFPTPDDPMVRRMLARKRPGDHPDYRETGSTGASTSASPSSAPRSSPAAHGFSTMRARRREKRSSWVLWNGAHLAALSAFALAQPLFDILGRNPEFFAVRGSTPTEIVLFALVVVFALPATLLALELAVSLLSRAAAQALHLVFVACLAAIIVLHLLTKTELIAGPGAFALAAAGGAAFAVVYRTVSGARSFLSILAPAPVVFLLLFLVGSPVSKLVHVETPEVQAATVKARTPVVLIVFDELASTALIDRDGYVDSRRWPNFAALARDSTWFRSATTVHPHTGYAVPAILDGKLPKPGLLPIFADHPRNLFTFLGGSYELEVIEADTHMCPPKLCRAAKTDRLDPNANDRTRSLASDVGIVYLHLLLPNPYAASLPPISNTWGDFGSHEEVSAEATGVVDRSTKTIPACARSICRFTSLIAASRKPTLYYLHTLLPHVPWLYLPSGKHYGGDVRVIPGTENGSWTDDRWLTIQAQQRYLLQLGYADQALGVVLHRLRAVGVYDRALVIVTGDHGETFLPGAPRRNVTSANLADVAFVPLFVKLPGQKRGRIDDSFATNMDVLPTIAKVLHTRIPWHVDGRSLVGGGLPADGAVTVLNSSGRPVQAPLSELRAQRARELSQQQAVFGTGPLERVYRIGPHPELLGRRVGSLVIRPSRGMSVELNGRELLRAVDLSSDLMPNYLTGRITGTRAQQNLAVALNGTIWAVTRSYTEFGTARFAALVPESAVRAGANDVAVFAVRESQGRVVLEELRTSNVTLALQGTPPVITSSDGTTIRFVQEALAGDVRALTRGDSVTFGGWAADLEARRPAESIVIFADGRSVYAGHPGNIARDDINKRYGVAKAGFLFQFPRSLVPAQGLTHQVRVFAIRGGIASELRYPPTYPWSTRP